MQHLRLSIGFGTVGRWLAGAVHQHQSWLEADCGVDLSIVGVATRAAKAFAIVRMDSTSARCLIARPPDGHWPTILGRVAGESGLDGLAATESDILAEASNASLVVRRIDTPNCADPGLIYPEQSKLVAWRLRISDNQGCFTVGRGIVRQCPL